MDAAAGLADLMEITSQIEAAVVLDRDGAALAATVPGERKEALARAARALGRAAAEQVPAGRSLAELHARTVTGSVFLVRDRERTVVAATRTAPAVALVSYDLKTCLRALAAGERQEARREDVDAGA